MTKIMHLKVPTLQNTKDVGIRDQYALSPALAAKYANMVKESLTKGTGENWVVLITPFEDVKILES
jgi:hypothetical protein